VAQTSFISAFARSNTEDENIESIQNSLENTFRSIESCPLLDGHLLEGVSIATGVNTIDHKLGRPIRGWIVTRCNAGLYLPSTHQDGNAHADETLILQFSQAATADIWVF